MSRTGGKARSKYIGKNLPTGLPGRMSLMYTRQIKA